MLTLSSDNFFTKSDRLVDYKWVLAIAHLDGNMLLTDVQAELLQPPDVLDQAERLLDVLLPLPLDHLPREGDRLGATSIRDTHLLGGSHTTVIPRDRANTSRSDIMAAANSSMCLQDTPAFLTASLPWAVELFATSSRSERTRSFDCKSCVTTVLRNIPSMVQMYLYRTRRLVHPSQNDRVESANWNHLLSPTRGILCETASFNSADTWRSV